MCLTLTGINLPYHKPWPAVATATTKQQQQQHISLRNTTNMSVLMIGNSDVCLPAECLTFHSSLSVQFWTFSTLWLAKCKFSSSFRMLFIGVYSYSSPKRKFFKSHLTSVFCQNQCLDNIFPCIINGLDSSRSNPNSVPIYCANRQKSAQLLSVISIPVGF